MPDPTSLADSVADIRDRIAAMGIDTTTPVDFDAVDRQIAEDWRAEQTRTRHALWVAQVPAEFADAHLDGIDDEGTREGLRSWLEHHGRNVILTGTTGVGKTYAAYALARAAWSLNLRSHIMTATEILQEFRPGGDPKVQSLILDVDLLLIDDLGAENDTPWTDETWTRIVDSRYRHKRPTVVTTNFATSDELRAKYGNRVVSRLLSNQALIVRITGPDRRARF